ncbi:MAG: ABC transporter ATP-binding protein [Alphaproteobacteria bacterium]|nr:ABC transporter ATP-binding protein [Alphaproteobacteria bacterium]
MSRVVFTAVQKRFAGVGGRPATLAVRSLDLEIESGTLVTLLGPSGCGKTTILRMLAGFEEPTSGTITIDGQDVTRLPANARGTGMVFQSYALFPHMTVRQNVAYGLIAAGRSTREVARKVDEVLALMQLGALAERAPEQLSGGQQQRVALARAIAIEPRVLLFDEPLSNLDAQLRERMRDELRALQQRLGITSLYVTHDQTEAMAISDRVVLMRDGAVEQHDTPNAVYTQPRTAFAAEFMGKANLLPACVTAVTEAGVDLDIGGLSARLSPSGRRLVPGDVLDCVVRPEHFVLGGPKSREVTVLRAIYQGGHAIYAVEIAGRSCTVVDAGIHQRGIAEAGQRIAISLAGAPVWPLLPAGQQESRRDDSK